MFTLKAGVVSQDPSWENIGAAIWSCIELNVSIIASTLPTLRPLIARLLPGIGLSSAHNERSTYLRYGSASAAIRAGAFKSTESRSNRSNISNKIHSISTEELALDDMRSSPARGTPAGIYTHASADPSKGFSPGKVHDESRIVMTTEISVASRAR
jgi:hypothetical protein